MTSLDDNRDAFGRLAEFAVGHAGDAVFFIGPDARVLYANEAACAALGHTRAELQGLRVDDFDVDMTHEAWTTHWDEVKREGHVTLTARHRTRDGREVPVEISANHVAFEGREYICAFARDVTVRHGAESEVRRSEARKAAMLSAALDAIITIDERGRILDFNPAAEEIFGHRRDDILGEDMAQLIIPDRMRAQHDAGMAHFLATGAGPVLGQRLELPAIRSDGSEFPSEVSIHALELDGHYLFTAYLRDISERKRAEQELEDARRQAEAANEAKSEFLARMSHDIRTPLTAISGYADILSRSDPTPDEVAKWSRVIRHNSEYLISLVNDVLDFSQIEAREVKLNLRDVELARLVSEVDSLFRPRAYERGLDFRVRCVGRVPVAVRTDATRLKQVLVNLLGNAIKYTPQGAVALEVHSKTRDDGIVELMFDVRDTGPGVAEDAREAIFEPFTRMTAEERQDEIVSGTGLGLSISRHFARLLGGDVTIDSQVGEGSCFSVSVEAGKVDTIELVERPEGFVLGSEDDSETRRDAAMEGRRVLIADDSPDNRRIVAFIVERAGGTTMRAADGVEALEMLRVQDFDLVLLDMQMPRLDGYDTVRELRARGDETPVIALTAFSMTGDRERCIDAGCDGYVAKPVVQADLFAEVTAVLRRAAEPKAPPATESDRESEEGFGPLLEAYRASLIEQAGEIDRQRVLADLESVGRLVHQVKGTGGAYGFPALTEAAARCDARVKAGDDLEALRSDLDELVGQMRSIGAHAAR